MEADQVDVVAFAVFCDFEQIDDAEKPRFACQLRRNVEEPDRFDGIDFDLAFLHRVAVPDLYVRAGPDADATGNLTRPDPLAQTFRKDQAASLHPSDATLT